ncbi:MAG: amino acid racemase [Oscillospiraceae bacterium]|nr:amino acid racemase [Oscillospiraceae bacterium]
MSERKILGVIGGMGPLATCEFLRGLVEHTAASCDQEHLDVLTYSHASLPGRTEALLAGDARALLDMLVEDAQMLRRGGAQVLAIPCNTSHVFYDDIQAAAGIPVIHIVRETVRSLEPGVTAAVLATEGTVRSDLYRREGEAAGLRVIYPPPEVQRRVTDIIEQVKAGGRLDTWALRAAAESLNGACDRVILGCTELSCAARGGPREPVFLDAMDVLIRESIRHCGGTYR